MFLDFFFVISLKSQDDVYLYGVFDGHDGARASNFAAQRMPAELLLGQLAGKSSDEEVKEVLYQVWLDFLPFTNSLMFSQKVFFKTGENIGKW